MFWLTRSPQESRPIEGGTSLQSARFNKTERTKFSFIFNFEGHRPEHNSWQSVTGNNERPCWNSGVSVGVPQSFIVTKESTEIRIS